MGKGVSLQVSDVIAGRGQVMDVLLSASSFCELSACFWPHWVVGQKLLELQNSYRSGANPQLGKGGEPKRAPER